MDLSSFFLSLRNEVARLTQTFELPSCRSLIIVKRQPGQANEYIEIEPRPMISTVNPRLIQAYEGIDGIQVELDDIQVNVPRSYTRDEISGRGIYYLIDAEMVDGEPCGGFEADKVPGLDLQEKDLHWELLLRRRV